MKEEDVDVASTPKIIGKGQKNHDDSNQAFIRVRRNHRNCGCYLVKDDIFRKGATTEDDD